MKNSWQKNFALPEESFPGFGIKTVHQFWRLTTPTSWPSFIKINLELLSYPALQTQANIHKYDDQIIPCIKVVSNDNKNRIIRSQEYCTIENWTQPVNNNETQNNSVHKMPPFDVHMLEHEILLMHHAALILLSVKHCPSCDSRRADLRITNTNKSSNASSPLATMFCTSAMLL